MALNLALYSQSAVTVSNTEYSLTNNSTSIAAKTDIAVIQVWIDIANMVAGDEYEVALQEKAASGGTQRRVVIGNLVGIGADPVWTSGAFQVGVGWDVTLKKIAGTDRAFSWSIRSVGGGSALNNALYTQSSVTISGTEYSLTNNSTTLATKTDTAVCSLVLDTNAIAAGDEFEVALLEKAVSGGTQRRMVLANLVGAQASPLFITAGMELGVGWDYSVKKIAGTDRAFSWSIRAIK